MDHLEYDGSYLANDGKSFFGATWEEFPKPRNRANVGGQVLLKQFGSIRRYPAEVTEVCPGGRICFADSEVTESTDAYHLLVRDKTGKVICHIFDGERHDFTIARRQLANMMARGENRIPFTGRFDGRSLA